jgi:hypothetical protein
MVFCSSEQRIGITSVFKQSVYHGDANLYIFHHQIKSQTGTICLPRSTFKSWCGKRNGNL